MSPCRREQGHRQGPCGEGCDSPPPIQPTTAPQALFPRGQQAPEFRIPQNPLLFGMSLPFGKLQLMYGVGVKPIRCPEPFSPPRVPVRVASPSSAPLQSPATPAGDTPCPSWGSAKTPTAALPSPPVPGSRVPLLPESNKPHRAPRAAFAPRAVWLRPRPAATAVAGRRGDTRPQLALAGAKNDANCP